MQQGFAGFSGAQHTDGAVLGAHHADTRIGASSGLHTMARHHPRPTSTSTHVWGLWVMFHSQCLHTMAHCRLGPP